MIPDDTDLIKQAIKGNAQAFETLVFKYDRQVLSIALKYVRNEDDAKDIYQEAFIRVYKNLKKFQFLSEFSTWLFRIVTNVCLTHKIKSNKRTFVGISEEYDEETELNNYGEVLVDEEATPERFTESSEIGDQINNKLEELPPKQKMVFVLKHYEGYKLKEIALMMDCQIGTVKKYLFEAVHKMRDSLKEYKNY